MQIHCRQVKDMSKTKYKPPGNAESDKGFNLLETITELIVVLDFNGAVLRLNSVSEAFFGIAQTELKGQPFWELFHSAENSESIRRIFTADSLLAERRELVLSMVSPDEETHLIRFTFSPEEYPDGRSGCIIVSGHDVTKGKRAEECMKSVNECLLALGQDYSSNIRLITETAAGILGKPNVVYNKCEVNTESGLLCYEVIQQNKNECVIVRDLPSTSFIKTDPCVRSGGFQTYIGHVVRCEGEPVGVLGILFSEDRKFTEPELQAVGALAAALGKEEDRHASESRLIESREKYRSIFNNIQDVYYEVSLEGNILEISPSIDQISGYEREELIGATFETFYSNPEDRIAYLEKLFAEGYVNDYHVLFRDKDGEVRHISLSSRIIFENGEPSKIIGTMRDITENYRNLEALKLSEQRFHDLANSLPEVIFEMDSDGTLSFINENAFGMFGYTIDEVKTGKLNAIAMIAPEDRERAAINIGEILSGESPRPVGFNEYVAVRKDGSIFPVLISSRPIYRDGELKGLRGIMIDISERKAAEDILFLEEQRLEALQKLSGMTDNTEEEISDYALAESIRLTSSKLGFLGFIADDGTMTVQTWFDGSQNSHPPLESSGTIRLESSGFLGEVARRRKTVILNDVNEINNKEADFPNTHMPVNRLMCIPLFEDEKVIAVAGAGNKNTDYDESDLRQLNLMMDGMMNLIRRKRASEMLRLSEEMFSKAFYSSPIGTILSTIDGGIFVKANDAFLELFGYGKDEVIDVSAIDLGLWINDRDREKITKALTIGKTLSNVEINLKHKDGTLLSCLGSAELIEIGGKAHMFAQIIDVSARRNAEREIRKKNTELKAAMAVKSEFLSMVSHELRTPLVPILGYAEMILDGSYGEISEKLRLPVGIMHNRAESLRILIDDLLQLSRMEHGSVSVHLVPVQVRDLVAALIDMYSVVDHVKPVTLQWEGEEYMVNADPYRLKQVVQNLIDNSIKYSGESVDITIRTGVSGNRGSITVIDNGIGISEDEIPYIFDRFYQIEPVNTRHHEGSGLGLAIAQELVQLMGGEITVESHPGQGTKFTITLDLLTLPGDPGQKPAFGNVVTPDRETANGETDPEASKLRVGVIDDDEFTIGLLEIMLAGKCEIFPAKSAKEGFELIKNQPVDLIFLDWVMPDMDGLTFLNKLRENEGASGIPVVFLSGRADEEAAMQAASAGATGFITKPFNKKDLLDILEKIRPVEYIINGS